MQCPPRIACFAGLVLALTACGNDNDDETNTAYEPGDLGASGPDGSAGAGDGDGAAGDGDTGNPGGACTTAEVRALLQVSCGTAGCHGGSAPAAALDLTVADPGAALTDTPSTLCSGTPLVVAGDPTSSLLWKKVAEDAPACGSRMPLGGVLPDADIDCIASWITSLAGGGGDCETCGGATCVDLQTDVGNCGGCGTACGDGEVCSDGTCEGCPAGTTACPGGCVDTTSDALNCGACGTACGAGQVCDAGACGCGASGAVSFAADVEPILVGTCAGRGCHSGPRPQQSLDLTAGNGHGELVGVASTQCNDDRPLVTAGDPGNSYLLNKLTGVGMCTGSLMPKGAGALPRDQLDTIAAWICDGAPDN